VTQEVGLDKLMKKTLLKERVRDDDEIMKPAFVPMAF
jgi:hypothetical protein